MIGTVHEKTGLTDDEVDNDDKDNESRNEQINLLNKRDKFVTENDKHLFDNISKRPTSTRRLIAKFYIFKFLSICNSKTYILLIQHLTLILILFGKMTIATITQ